MDYRFERKFITSDVSPKRAMFLVRRHPAMFREVYPQRWVNNIYFDTLDLTNVQDNLAGVSQRTKIRVRWYGDSLGRIETPVLELKIKRGSVNRKVLHRLPTLEAGGACCSSRIREMLERSAMPELLALRMRLLRPTLMNRYSRHYYQSANGHYRITIDAQMSFRPIMPLTKHPVQWTSAHSVVVLELKYAMDHDDNAAAIAQHLPLRVSKSSKYVAGMCLVYPRLVY